MVYEMDAEEVAAMYEESRLYARVDDIVDLMMQHGSDKILNMVYDRYFDVAYGELQKKYGYTV